MTKAINFDMDGTLCDFYGVEGWLDCLIARDPKPYAEAKPLLNLSALARKLNRLQRDGYEINIISWLAKHLPSVHWDNVTIVPYGVNKSTLGNGILFDDEKPNRNMWGDGAYDATNILGVLKAI